MEAYDFAEWNDWRLEQRLSDVQESFQLPHNPLRKSQVEREMSHLIFEIGYRSGWFASVEDINLAA